MSDPEPAYRIEDMARLAGTTVRTVRAYQDRGLLPRPTRRGRANVYGEAHLARLRQITRLLGRGYTLSAIGELLTAWDNGRGLDGILGIATGRGDGALGTGEGLGAGEDPGAAYGPGAGQGSGPREDPGAGEGSGAGEGPGAGEDPGAGEGRGRGEGEGGRGEGGAPSAPGSPATGDAPSAKQVGDPPSAKQPPAPPPPARISRSALAELLHAEGEKSIVEDALRLGLVEQAPDGTGEFLVMSRHELRLAAALRALGAPLRVLATLRPEFTRTSGEPPLAAALVRARLPEGAAPPQEHAASGHTVNVELPEPLVRAVVRLVGRERSSEFIAVAAQREVQSRMLDALAAEGPDPAIVDQLP